MKIIFSEDLKKATPYMLRNDGEVFTCGMMHPYIKYAYDEDSVKELVKLLTLDTRKGFLKWFYDNTQYAKTREYIQIVLKSAYKQNISDIDDTMLAEFDISDSTNYTEDINELSECYELLNSMCNQEFCRVRTSSMKFGGNSNDIYFRISSIGFNWFDVIWDFVYKNKNFISTVTITNDPQTSGGAVEFYTHGNAKMDSIPVDDFISLSGNPVFECMEDTQGANKVAAKRLAEGYDIASAYGDIHPRYVLGFFNRLKKRYKPII